MKINPADNVCDTTDQFYDLIENEIRARTVVKAFLAEIERDKKIMKCDFDVEVKKVCTFDNHISFVLKRPFCGDRNIIWSYVLTHGEWVKWEDKNDANEVYFDDYRASATPDRIRINPSQIWWR